MLPEKSLNISLTEKSVEIARKLSEVANHLQKRLDGKIGLIDQIYSVEAFGCAVLGGLSSVALHLARNTSLGKLAAPLVIGINSYLLYHNFTSDNGALVLTQLLGIGLGVGTSYLTTKRKVNAPDIETNTLKNPLTKKAPSKRGRFFVKDIEPGSSQESELNMAIEKLVGAKTVIKDVPQEVVESQFSKVGLKAVFSRTDGVDGKWVRVEYPYISRNGYGRASELRFVTKAGNKHFSELLDSNIKSIESVIGKTFAQFGQKEWVLYKFGSVGNNIATTGKITEGRFYGGATFVLESIDTGSEIVVGPVLKGSPSDIDLLLVIKRDNVLVAPIIEALQKNLRTQLGISSDSPFSIKHVVLEPEEFESR